MDLDHNLARYLIAPFGMLFTWACAYAYHRTARHRQDAQKEVQIALLNRFSSGQEMSSFLATDEGRRLVDQLASAPDAKDPMQLAVGITMGGLINVALAVAFYLLTWRGMGVFVVPAYICAAVGVALLLSAALSYSFAKKRERDKKDR